MKRRSFLFATFAAFAGLVGVRFASTTDAESIVMILRKRLNYLKMDANGLHAFAHDLAARHEVSTGRLSLVEMAGPFYTKVDYSGENLFSKTLRHGEEKIITLYLLSSDFFVNGTDVSRTVHYLGYYDPLHACGDPFARRVG